MADSLDGAKSTNPSELKGDESPIVAKNSDDRDLAPPKLIEIDPIGDVYLVLDTIKLRVSSKALSLASKVFSVMFQPSFREGVTLAQHDTCEVPLPDDNEEPMHALCILFHHQHPDSITYQIDAQFLHETAILVDKYACASAVYLWADHHLTRLANQSQRAENEDAMLLYATCGFDNHTQFQNTTRRMVFSTSPWPLTGELVVPTWGLNENVQALLPQGLLGFCPPRAPAPHTVSVSMLHTN